MKKLGLLRTFLELQKYKKFDAWVENIELKTRGSNEGNKVLLHTMEYRAVFSIEGYAYQKYPIELFNARLLTWLADNDDRQDLEDSSPNITIDLLDNETADIELTLQFEEDVYITEIEGGPIEYAGRTWALEEPEHDVAESFELIVANGD